MILFGEKFLQKRTIPIETKRTTNVLIAVARLESTLKIPIFNVIVVSAANNTLPIICNNHLFKLLCQKVQN